MLPQERISTEPETVTKGSKATTVYKRGGLPALKTIFNFRRTESARKGTLGMATKKTEDLYESASMAAFLIAAYFVCYTGTGVTPKIFTKGLIGAAKIAPIVNAVYNNIGGVIATLTVLILLKWHKRLPKIPLREYKILIPSAISTAVILPTTIIMLGVSVNPLVAMVIMRGCVIILGRLVDAIQIGLKMVTKKVSWEENVATVIALASVVVAAFGGKSKEGSKEDMVIAAVTLAAYVTAYGIRLFVMNIAKNREGLAISDGRTFFAGEQVSMLVFLSAIVAVVYSIQPASDVSVVGQAHFAMHHLALLPILGGSFFGLGSVPSVLLFMFRGKTMTWSSLANRLTSLLAGGLVASLILWKLGMDKPTWVQAVSFGLALVASGFLLAGGMRQKESTKTV